MKNLFPILIIALTTPALADVIIATESACHIYEFDALELAVAKIKKSALDYCSQQSSNKQNVSIQSSKVEQTAPCNGYKITSVVECVPF